MRGMGKRMKRFLKPSFATPHIHKHTPHLSVFSFSLTSILVESWGNQSTVKLDQLNIHMQCRIKCRLELCILLMYYCVCSTSFLQFFITGSKGLGNSKHAICELRRKSDNTFHPIWTRHLSLPHRVVKKECFPSTSTVRTRCINYTDYSVSLISSIRLLPCSTRPLQIKKLTVYEVMIQSILNSFSR